MRQVSPINNYEAGSIKMVDFEGSVKYPQLIWPKRIFGENSGR